jgi:hypothetical protein
MLAEAGIKLDFELSDNELRYILWRSYQNLANPGRYNIVKRIEDVAVRARLGIGEYAPASEEIVQVAEEDTAEYDEDVLEETYHQTQDDVLEENADLVQDQELESESQLEAVEQEQKDDV